MPSLTPKPKPAPTPRRRTSIGRLFRLAKKELVEILRDRRTIITLVMMPVLLYPLMGIIVQKFLLSSIAPPASSAYRIGIDDPGSFEYFQRLVLRGSKLISDKNDDDEDDDAPPIPTIADTLQQLTPNTDAPTEEEQAAEEFPGQDQLPEFVTSDNEPMEELLQAGEVDLAIFTKTDAMGRPYFELVSRPDSTISKEAERWVVERFEVVNLAVAKRAMGRLPAEFSRRKTAPETDPDGETTANRNLPPLLTFIPLMLVLMTMTGAVYPAIDLTAGERERGTMEILVAAPVSRMALLFGKFVAVLTVAMLTAVFNIAAMAITLYMLNLEHFVFGEQGLPLHVMFSLLGLLLVFAAFFSATLLCLTSFARSFKEAQAYLIPLMLVSLGPGLLSLMPNVELTPMLAIAPLVNIVMLSRDLLAGDANLAMTAVVVLSTIFYGTLALAIAARIFGTDSMLAGGASTWSDLFRKPTEIRDQPEIATAMSFLAVLFPSFIVIAGLAGRFGSTIDTKLILNAIVTFCLFVLLPIAFTLVFRLRFRTSFMLMMPPMAGLLAAVLLGCSIWTLAYELEIFILSPSRIDEWIKTFEETLKVGMADLGLPIKLFCLAIIPAVCEEFTFRGFLMSAFRKRIHPIGAVLVTALLFGLFHVFVRDFLMFERLLPSTLMGILLGFVCLRTGSVIPGMILHVLHNGLLLTIAHYESELTEMGLGIAEQKHLPATWLAIAAVPIALGIALLIFFPKKEQDSPEIQAVESKRVDA